jgi:hypothetical protein
VQALKESLSDHFSIFSLYHSNQSNQIEVFERFSSFSVNNEQLIDFPSPPTRFLKADISQKVLLAWINGAENTNPK